MAVYISTLPAFFFLGVAESVVNFFGVVSVGSRALPSAAAPFFLGDRESKHKFRLAFNLALEVEGPPATLSSLTLDAGFLTTTAAALLPPFLSLLRCPP